MNCLLVMKIKWSLDINTSAVERSEAARARRLAGATVVGPVTARADQLWHAETGPPDQIWRRTNYRVTGPSLIKVQSLNERPRADEPGYNVGARSRGRIGQCRGQPVIV